MEKTNDKICPLCSTAFEFDGKQCRHCCFKIQRRTPKKIVWIKDETLRP